MNKSTIPAFSMSPGPRSRKPKTLRHNRSMSKYLKKKKNYIITTHCMSPVRTPAKRPKIRISAYFTQGKKKFEKKEAHLTKHTIFEIQKEQLSRFLSNEEFQLFFKRRVKKRKPTTRDNISGSDLKKSTVLKRVKFNNFEENETGKLNRNKKMSIGIESSSTQEEIRLPETLPKSPIKILRRSRKRNSINRDNCLNKTQKYQNNKKLRTSLTRCKTQGNKKKFQIIFSKAEIEQQNQIKAQLELNKELGQSFLEKIEVTRILGHGSFATVYHGIDKQTNQINAIKVLRKKPNRKDEIANEIEVLKKIKDSVKTPWGELELISYLKGREQICSLDKVIEDEKNVYILMENCGGVNLKQFLKQETLKKRLCLNNPQSTTLSCSQFVGIEKQKKRCMTFQLIGTPEEQAKLIFKQVCEGVRFLHESLDISHRDLKLSNIMIKNEKENEIQVKIIDFGLASFLNYNINGYQGRPFVKGVCGTPPYMSPELYNAQKKSSTGRIVNGKAADVWALGVILFRILTGVLPFGDSKEPMLRKLISEASLIFPVKLSSSAKDLIKRCLDKEPEARPKIREILEHSWFKP